MSGSKDLDGFSGLLPASDVCWKCGSAFVPVGTNCYGKLVLRCRCGAYRVVGV